MLAPSGIRTVRPLSVRPLAHFATLIAVGLFATLIAPRSSQAAATAADVDLVLLNGHIITVDAHDSIAQALAADDGVIVKVGTNDQIRPLIGSHTVTLDLHGKTVTPGLVDSHAHVMYYGQVVNDFINLRPPLSSIAQIVTLIADAVSASPPGTWVIGDGYFKLDEGRNPTRWDLDPISPDNPVFLNSIGGHFGVANSKALEIAGVTKNTPDPVGGIIEKDPTTGELTGRLWNHPAMDVVRAYFPPLDPHDLIADAHTGEDRFAAEGITTFQDVNARGIARYNAYRAAEHDAKLRGYILVTIERADDATVALNQTELFTGTMLSHTGNKFLLDGQPPTSYTYDPHPGPSYNMPTWNPDTLKTTVKQLHRAGRQLAFHVMGDKAIDLALDVIEEALNDSPRADHRHRLEHVMIPTTAAIDRMRRLGIIYSTQPGAIYSGGENYFAIWGAERTQRLLPLRSVLDAGIPLALGSDFPTVPDLAPQQALWESVARQTASGVVIASQQSITIHEALRAYTMGSAYAGFEEDVKGSLEEGKFADLDVWSGDLYSVPTAQIRQLHTVMTFVGGKVVAMAGDVTADGTVRANDLVRAVDFATNRVTPSDAQKLTADIDRDGAVQTDDLSGIVHLAFDPVADS